MPKSAVVYRSLVSGAAALTFGAILGWSAHDNNFWQISHSVTPWVLLGAASSHGLAWRAAVWQTTFAFISAVLAFYTVRNIIIGGYGLNKFEVTFWVVASLAGGLLFGLVGWSLRGSPDWRAIGMAALFGLTIVDSYAQYKKESSYLNSALWLDVVALIVFVVYGFYRRVAPRRVAVAVLPLIVLSYVFLSVPDVIEKLVITRSI